MPTMTGSSPPGYCAASSANTGKTVLVQAKDGQALDGKAITAEIVDSGYDVVKLEAVQQSVAELKAELKDRK